MRRLLVALLAVLLSLGSWSDAGADDLTTWNPNASETLGLEAFFTQQGDQQLPVAFTFTSSVAETVDSITLPLGLTGGDATLLVEIFVAGDEVPGAVSTQVYRPNSDLTIGGNDSEDNSWLTQALGTTNLYQSIDETTVSDTDYVFYFGPQNPPDRYRHNIGSAAWAANRRVVGGFERVRARRQDATGQLEVAYYNGTAGFKLQTVTVTKKWQNFNVPWPEYVPGTGLPWTQTEIAALDSTSGIQFRTKNVNKRKILQVSQAYTSLDYVTEDRVAVGVLDVSPQDPGTATTFTLSHPNTGADNWSKADATDYTVVVRRIGGFGVGSARFLTETPEASAALLRPDQDVANPISSYVPVLDSRGMVSSLGDRVPGRAQSFYLTRTDAAVSVDGQPYVYLSSELGTFGIWQGYQTITTPAGTYETIRFLWAEPNAATEETSQPDMTMEVQEVSSGTPSGSTETFTIQEMTAAPAVGSFVSDGVVRTVHFIERVMATPATLTATQWAVVFTSAPTQGVVAAVGSNVTGGGNPSFGGETDLYGTSFTGDLAYADAPVTLSTEVDPPADLTPTVVETDTDTGEGCTVPYVETVELDWTPAGLGSGFGRYEIERSDDAGATWFDLREGGSDQSATATDLETPRGTSVLYRIRSVRTGDWVPSAWDTTTAVTCQPTGGEVVFASNWLESLEAVTRSNEYQWPQPVNDRVLQLSGRDYQIVFQETEVRGDGGADGFTFTANVYTPNWNDPANPDPGGREAFAPLIDFLRTYTPYLAVNDWNGDQWYGRATVNEASVTMTPDEAGLYSAEIVVVQTQALPTPAPIEDGS